MTLKERTALQIKHNNTSALQREQPEKDIVPLVTPFTASLAMGILHATQCQTMFGVLHSNVL